MTSATAVQLYQQEDLLELLDGEEGGEGDAIEGPGFGVVAAVVVGVGFVPIEVTVAAAPT